MIWDNDFIKIRQQTINWARWKGAGILYINDLLHQHQPRFLSHQELADERGIPITFLELLQIRSALPCTWKRRLTPTERQELQIRPTIYNTQGEPMPLTGKSSRFIYYTLVKYLKPNITSQARWNELFPVNNDQQQEYWSNIYRCLY